MGFTQHIFFEKYLLWAGTMTTAGDPAGKENQARAFMVLMFWTERTK